MHVEYNIYTHNSQYKIFISPSELTILFQSVWYHRVASAFDTSYSVYICLLRLQGKQTGGNPTFVLTSDFPTVVQHFPTVVHLVNRTQL